MKGKSVYLTPGEITFIVAKAEAAQPDDKELEKELDNLVNKLER